MLDMLIDQFLLFNLNRNIGLATHAALIRKLLKRLELGSKNKQKSLFILSEMAKRKSQGRRKSHVAGSSHDATEDVEDRHTAPDDVEDRHRRLHASFRRVRGRFGEDQDVGGTSNEERRDPCEMIPEPSRQTTPEPSPPSRQMTPQSSAESEHEVDVEHEVNVELQVDVEPEVGVELEGDAGARRDEVPVQTEAPFPGGLMICHCWSVTHITLRRVCGIIL
ncbi:uncharacterized protein LOC130712460 [Lotus japonicus]|uniref:uncharacterized protein LOC130712460 n=1 Tax=Lotus japonicus TaxID=34305 RepID=UPI00258F86ED|nr:uncharacterized protein LOC130712460 [Lotus japonicus]